jgi:hypothetical protein
MKSSISMREYEDAIARAKHNRVDIRERCDRCGEVLSPKDMVVGDFEQYHAWCERGGKS